MTDLKSVATEVETIDEAIMKAFPFISGMIGFIPGGAVAVPFMPLVGELLQAIDNAAKDVAAGNTGAAAQDILSEVMNHMTKGKPNSPILSETATPPST